VEDLLIVAIEGGRVWVCGFIRVPPVNIEIWYQLTRIYKNQTVEIAIGRYSSKLKQPTQDDRKKSVEDLPLNVQLVEG
jgi:hypothetical protein